MVFSAKFILPLSIALIIYSTKSHAAQEDCSEVKKNKELRFYVFLRESGLEYITREFKIIDIIGVLAYARLIS